MTIHNGRDDSRIARSPALRCEICMRRLAPRSLTIVHDDIGDHDLCDRCETFYSENAMRYFARELHEHARGLALLSLLLLPVAYCLLPAAVSAADYYIYKDAAGRTILSNLPADRVGANNHSPLRVEKKYQWSETTDAEIEQARIDNAATARVNALRDLASSNAQIAREMRMAREQSAQAPRIEVNTIDVNQATTVLGDRSRIKGDRSWVSGYRSKPGTQYPTPKTYHPTGRR